MLVVAPFGNLELLRLLGEREKNMRLHILVHTPTPNASIE